MAERAWAEAAEVAHRSYECDLCDAQFREPEMLASHRREAHAPDDELACQFCGDDFGSQTELEHHERLAHTAAPPDSVPCPSCGRHFDNAAQVEEHLAQAHPRFPGMTRPT